MKNKLSLFVTVLAAALFGVGCTLTIGNPGSGKQQVKNQQPEETTKPTKPEKPVEPKETVKSTEPEKPTEPKEPAFVKEGLVAYYPFNGNAEDESGNGNDGINKGATPSNDRHTNPNSSLTFDGKDDYIHILNSPSLNPKKGLTITAWIQPAALNRGLKLLTKGSGYQNNYDFSVGISGKDNSYGYGWRPTRGLAVGVEAKGFKFTEKIWAHVVVTHDSGTSPKVYVNGIKQTLTTSSTYGRDEQKRPRTMYNQPLTIGTDPKGPSGNRNHFYGGIDDIRIYSRSLPEEQVKALYDLEKPKR